MRTLRFLITILSVVIIFGGMTGIVYADNALVSQDKSTALESKGSVKEIPQKKSISQREQRNRTRKLSRSFPPRVYIYIYRGYDHAYRDKVSWLKGKMSKNRVADWRFGNSRRGVIIYKWDDAPPEIAQQLRERAFH